MSSRNSHAEEMDYSDLNSILSLFRCTYVYKRFFLMKSQMNSNLPMGYNGHTSVGNEVKVDNSRLCHLR